MKFQTVGDVRKPAVLLIHAMFVSGESFLPLAEYLKYDYFLIMPTLDGHCDDDSIYENKQEEAGKILSYLNEQGIKELEIIVGTSMGAIIALEVFLQSNILINSVYLDGGPFFRFPELVKKIMYKKFWDICLTAKKGTKSNFNIVEHMPAMKALKGEFQKVCRNMKKKNVRNLVETCYNCVIPDLDEQSQRKLTFLFGSKEPAYLCLPRLKKYEYSTFLIKKGYTHCEYIIMHPDKYAKMLMRRSKCK